MGKLIMTSGKEADFPYILQKTKIQISSIEELCYHILNNPGSCEDFVKDERLAVFVRDELGLYERGELILDLIEKGASVRDIVTAFFCSCDYCDRREIEEFLSIRAEYDMYSDWQKNKKKADELLSEGLYTESAMIYRSLIREKNMGGISRENLGNIYHNLGIATIKAEGFSSAYEYFEKAYEYNRNVISLKHYLLCLLVLKKNDMYDNALKKYDVPIETSDELIIKYDQYEKKDTLSKEIPEFEKAKKAIRDRKYTNFYDSVNVIIKQMKEEYRKDNGGDI